MNNHPANRNIVQRITEQDGYMLLYFDDPPDKVGELVFVNCLAYQHKHILFCKWRSENIWVLPGGRIEPKETAEETLHRELMEETGATLKNFEVLCYIHCFMFDLEYWGIAYLGEIENLGNPTDLNEVSAAKLFSDYPKNRSKPEPFRNQGRALYDGALQRLSHN